MLNGLIDICDYDIVVVDDGSGEEYKYIFDTALKLGCTVLIHEKNMGKGAALKTGFQYIREAKEDTGVVTAECDGQHLPNDIIKIAEAIKEQSKLIVLGTRIYDTQTGLRGFSIDMLPWLCEVSGDRFEYEMNMLPEAVPAATTFMRLI